ncbi:hypothetical protein PYCC9005_000637 [Savitreella phatthalungensis]
MVSEFILNAAQVEDANVIAAFVSNAEVSSLMDLRSETPVDCLVLCGSAILQCAEHVFRSLQGVPIGGTPVFKTLVICGGIGHSTELLYTAVKARPEYAGVLEEVEMPAAESQVLYEIGRKCFDLDAVVERTGVRVVVEDKSTNCGANAFETRKVLKQLSIPTTKQLVIVQDPTMSRRTKASFEKAYSGDLEDERPEFICCPSFVPQLVASKTEGVAYDQNSPGLVDGNVDGLWEGYRFLSLLLGEIPRMRDDKDGYGPAGKDFIAHVDIPGEVEEAYTRLKQVVEGDR